MWGRENSWVAKGRQFREGCWDSWTGDGGGCDIHSDRKADGPQCHRPTRRMRATLGNHAIEKVM